MQKSLCWMPNITRNVDIFTGCMDIEEDSIITDRPDDCFLMADVKSSSDKRSVATIEICMWESLLRVAADMSTNTTGFNVGNVIGTDEAYDRHSINVGCGTFGKNANSVGKRSISKVLLLTLSLAAVGITLGIW